MAEAARRTNKKSDTTLRVVAGSGGGGGGRVNQGTGGGGSGGPFATQQYVDMKVDGLETRLTARLDRLPTWRQMAWTVAGIATAGVIATATILGIMLSRSDSADARWSDQVTQQLSENRTAIDAVQERQREIASTLERIEQRQKQRNR